MAVKAGCRLALHQHNPYFQSTHPPTHPLLIALDEPQRQQALVRPHRLAAGLRLPHQLAHGAARHHQWRYHGGGAAGGQSLRGSVRSKLG